MNFKKIIEPLIKEQKVKIKEPLTATKEIKPNHDVLSSILTVKTKPKSTIKEDLKEEGFEMGEVLGEGSYSVVRAATYKKTDIAVKVIDRAKVSHDFSSKFLPREVEILSKIKHKSIISVIKIFNYPTKVYIFMEYLPRGDLLQHLREDGSLGEKKSKHYFKQMVGALQYLHGQNITHRDLKCENILLDNKDGIRIIDFGFCRKVVTSSGRRVLCETYCGSTAYAAPEVLQGTPYNPMLYDVWSLGCILFIMVTRCMPFDESNVRLMVEYQLKRKIKYPRRVTVSFDVRDIIQKMLEPDVTKRISMDRISQHKWLTEDDELLK
nr:testis-specific serine/threonine-protein kinase 1-like [Parasteatoda tepidariorum]